jgi:hypothetical protein
MHTAANGSIVILNEDKVAYPVDKADAAVWSQCTGIAFEQLRDAISSKLGWQIPPDVLSHLERFVNWCIWAKLIEVRDFTPDQFAQLMQQDELDKEVSRKLASTAQKENQSGSTIGIGCSSKLLVSIRFLRDVLSRNSSADFDQFHALDKTLQADLLR